MATLKKATTAANNTFTPKVLPYTPALIKKINTYLEDPTPSIQNKLPSVGTIPLLTAVSDMAANPQNYTDFDFMALGRALRIKDSPPIREALLRFNLSPNSPKHLKQSFSVGDIACHLETMPQPINRQVSLNDYFPRIVYSLQCHEITLLHPHPDVKKMAKWARDIIDQILESVDEPPQFRVVPGQSKSIPGSNEPAL
jgi:hypothetical protein